ncbi:MAG: hypothetical protein EBR82_19310 [Caulobacteraceae bacterium]|nr:hypothetical protein [Caulobacteraceae bacterium]
MSWQNNNLMISQDYDLNDACNKLISSCLSLLHKGKLKAFNDILKETVKQNDIVLRETTKKTRKTRKTTKKSRSAKKAK